MREILSTPRLLIREIAPTNLPGLHRIYRDPECMRFYPAPKSCPETRAWFQELAFDSYARNGFGLWAVISRDTGDPIGDCGLTLQRTPAGQEPEVGYHLWRGFWHQGLATEAARACVCYGLDILRMPRVVSITSPENLPSQKVAERVHQRREVFTRISRATGQEVLRYLYVTDAEA
ncbi:GNAT family N-acetyltransferase [Microvirga sp. TS319]|uniref:GNAT family N-acetyltransferase n=1 Tax=Microvirga sp. TS319 TaxID=3241165 RepID=UPI00351A5FF0